MNLLAFVFSLLLILSYGFVTTFEKWSGSHRIRSTYLGHIRANRKILSSYENEIYKSFSFVPKPKQEAQKKPPNPKEPQQEEEEDPLPLVNKECARINLAPLIQTGIEENRLLYDLTVKLLKTFYGKPLFHEKTQAEAKFLNAFLKIAQSQSDLPLEKFDFGDSELQEIYYHMLKGTKKSYPSLLDYLTIELDSKEPPICLFHAHPNLITVLFGPKATQKIYKEMHKQHAPAITKEVIERLCSEVHTPIYDPAIFTLLKLGKPVHKKGAKRTLIETDQETAITLRKDLLVRDS